MEADVADCSSASARMASADKPEPGLAVAAAANVTNAPSTRTLYSVSKRRNQGRGSRRFRSLRSTVLGPGARRRSARGLRRCPPLRGVPARAIANRQHPETLVDIEWAGGAYDAAAVDPTAVVFDTPRHDGRRRSSDSSVHLPTKVARQQPFRKTRSRILPDNALDIHLVRWLRGRFLRAGMRFAPS